jgi:hypothetical protein
MNQQETVEQRIKSMIDEPGDRQDIEEMLAEGYARALRLDAERLSAERAIAELAGRAEEPEAAQELRQAWLRLRTLTGELDELRELLRRLKEAA